MVTDPLACAVRSLIRHELWRFCADHDKVSQRGEEAAELPSHGHHQGCLQVRRLLGHTRHRKLPAREELSEEDVRSAAAGDDSRRRRFLSECDIVH